MHFYFAKNLHFYIDFCIRLNGRILIAGDGTKVIKEARFMSGVKKLHQESEDISKPEYIHGHMFGGIGAVIGNRMNPFSIPLDLTIQDGLQKTADWENGNPSASLSHVLQMILNCCAVTAAFEENTYCVLDRYFLSVDALKKLNSCNQDKEYRMDLITRAKTNCIAFQKPVQKKGGRGRPRKRGTSVKLAELFDTRQADFIKVSITMYSGQEEVEYLAVNLLWGATLYQELRFVLVKRGGSRSIFVSTDVSLDPVQIMQAYSYRFKIECMFRELKQQIHAFNYRFWTKSTPKLDKYKKKGDPDPLSKVKDPLDRQRILKTVDATERFTLCSEIAMGMIQLIAVNPIFAKIVKDDRYVRTECKGKVSEAAVIEYLRKHFFRLMLLHPSLYITRLIKKHQISDLTEEEAA